THEGIIALGQLTTAGLTAAFFAYVYSAKRQLYLLFWAAGWSLLALESLSPTLEPWPGATPWQEALNHWLLGAAGRPLCCPAPPYAPARPRLGRLPGGGGALCFLA